MSMHLLCIWAHMHTGARARKYTHTGAYLFAKLNSLGVSVIQLMNLWNPSSLNSVYFHSPINFIAPLNLVTFQQIMCNMVRQI